MKVMTFNLKFATLQPPNSWEQRRPVTRELILQTSPDIIGTQEGLYHQLCDIQSDCPAYDWIGLGREGGSHGEFCAIFYKRSRFKLLEFDHFWLSDTPKTIGSITWGHHCVRMTTWARFLDRGSQEEFYVFNTHLDHEIQMAREKGARLILERMKIDINPNLPIILTGDFNAAARANPAYDMFINDGSFKDAWYLAESHPGKDYGTWHEYKEPIPNGPHIDWILLRGDWECSSASVIDFNINGQYPSDHFPVLCNITLNKRA